MTTVTQQELEQAIRYYHGKGDMEKVRKLGSVLMQGQPERPGVTGSFMRGAATSIPGILDLASNYLVKPVLDLPAMLSGERIPRAPRAESAQIVASLTGIPAPTTAGERMAEIAGASAIPGLGAVGMAPKGQKLLTAGTEALSALGAGVGQEVAGTPGMLVGGLTPYAGAGLIRQVAATKPGLPVGEMARAPEQQMLETFQRQQVPATMGDVTGMAAPQAIAEKIPGGYGVMKKARESQASAMERRVDQITETVDDISAGMTLRTGITGWVDNSFKPTSRKLFKRLNSFIPDAAPAITTNSTRIANEIVENAGPFADIFTHPTMLKVRDRMDEIAQAGGMNFQQLRQLRSTVGEKLASTDLVTDLPRADLKQLYKEISRDLEQTIAASGNKRAKEIYQKANNYYKKGIKRVDNYLQPLLGRGKLEKVDEEVFQALQRQIRGKPTRAIELGKSLKPADRETVLSAVIRELGVPTDAKMSGVWTFSPETFLTKLNGIDERAFKSLAKNTRFAKWAGNDLKDLKVIAEQLRESVKYMQNPSGTGQALTSTLLGGGGGGALAGGIAFSSAEAMATGLLLLTGTPSGAWATAKLMANPRFVKWVTDGTKMPPAQLGSHVARLGNVAMNESAEVQEAVRLYLDLLTGQ